MKFKAYANLRIVYYGQKHNLGFRGIKYVRKGDTVNIPSGCTMDEVEFYPMFKYMEADRSAFKPLDILPDLLPIENNSLESVVGNLEGLKMFEKCKM